MLVGPHVFEALGDWFPLEVLAPFVGFDHCRIAKCLPIVSTVKRIFDVLVIFFAQIEPVEDSSVMRFSLSMKVIPQFHHLTEVPHPQICIFCVIWDY